MKKLVEAALLFAFLGLGLFGWMSQCIGPDPEVDSVELQEPQQPGGPWVAMVTVKNHGGGDGHVNVTVRLIDEATGQSFHAERDITIGPDEETTLAVEVNAPDGEYRAEAKATYPQN